MAKERLKEISIDRRWCKGCGICVHFCPGKVLALDEKDKAVAASPADCVVCRMCELRCPDLAITVVSRDAPPEAGEQDQNHPPADSGSDA